MNSIWQNAVLTVYFKYLIILWDMIEKSERAF